MGLSRYLVGPSPVKGAAVYSAATSVATPVFSVDVVIDLAGWEVRRRAPVASSPTASAGGLQQSDSESEGEESLDEEAQMLAGIRFRPEPEQLKQVPRKAMLPVVCCFATAGCARCAACASRVLCGC